MLTLEELTDHLRDALRHLHDPSRLPNTPLAAWLGVAGRPSSFSALQKILTEAIECLEPDGTERAHSHAWRIYDALYYRYIEGLGPDDVAAQLGISPRHLRREQQAAIEVLARKLWHSFDLSEIDGEETIGPDAVSRLAGRPMPDADLAWLRDHATDVRTDLTQVLTDALSLARPLAEKHGVHLESRLPVMVPSVSVHPVMLSQMLLNLLSVAIHQTIEGTVSVTVQARGPSASVQLGGDRPLTDTLASSESDEANLEMTRKLASLCRGALKVLAEADGFMAVLRLPAVQQIPVLFIDDTEDVLQLVERYLTGTRFRVISARDPRKAFRLVEEYDPEIIVLDVMMPQIDGWHTLGLLRQHPLTSHIPVVVYTILAQEDLALSLGASAFVQKTASRQTLVRTLETVVSKKQTRPH